MGFKVRLDVAGPSASESRQYKPYTASGQTGWLAALEVLVGSRPLIFLPRFSGAFLPQQFPPFRLSVALTASPQIPARPLVVPSEDYSHGGGLAAPLFREGRRKDGTAEQKKHHENEKSK